jgi:hypothetical protein
MLDTYSARQYNYAVHTIPSHPNPLINLDLFPHSSIPPNQSLIQSVSQSVSRPYNHDTYTYSPFPPGLICREKYKHSVPHACALDPSPNSCSFLLPICVPVAPHSQLLVQMPMPMLGLFHFGLVDAKGHFIRPG